MPLAINLHTTTMLLSEVRNVGYKDLLLIQTNYGFALNDSEGGFEDITQGLSFSVLGRLKF